MTGLTSINVTDGDTIDSIAEDLKRVRSALTSNLSVHIHRFERAHSYLLTLRSIPRSPDGFPERRQRESYSSLVSLGERANDPLALPYAAEALVNLSPALYRKLDPEAMVAARRLASMPFLLPNGSAVDTTGSFIVNYANELTRVYQRHLFGRA